MEMKSQSEISMKVIAHIRTDFPEKFGIPRQPRLVESLEGRIVFEPEYRSQEALRGLEGFSHIWLLWEFSENVRSTWSPTVRPPRLGGNTRMGVFATRSPYRPNPIGLSVVALSHIELQTPEGPVLTVCGVDLMDGTPIYDIKPYLPHVDSIPEATGGFVADHVAVPLIVEIPESWLSRVPETKRDALRGILEQDPRPSYQSDPERVYGLSFAGLEVRFTVREGRLTVCGIETTRAL